MLCPQLVGHVFTGPSSVTTLVDVRTRNTCSSIQCRVCIRFCRALLLSESVVRDRSVWGAHPSPFASLLCSPQTGAGERGPLSFQELESQSPASVLGALRLCGSTVGRNKTKRKSGVKLLVPRHVPCPQ